MALCQTLALDRKYTLVFIRFREIDVPNWVTTRGRPVFILRFYSRGRGTAPETCPVPEQSILN